MNFSLLHALPINTLFTITEFQKKNLEKIGLYTVRDLLLHFPIRYEDHTYINKIGHLTPGVYATIVGRLLSCVVSFDSFKKKKMLICKIKDISGVLIIRFFNFKEEMEKKFFLGSYILVHGKVKKGKNSNEMHHPMYRVLKNPKLLKLKNTLTPVYLTTNGIKQTKLRFFIEKALDILDKYVIDEVLPKEIIYNRMISFSKALHILHNPTKLIKISDLNKRQHPAQRRLIFEELLAYTLSMFKIREKAQYFRAYILTGQNHLKKKFIFSLPFQLTCSQKKVISEIECDMALNIPMMRLVQGDVGSGKTLIAAISALNAITHGKQVVLMVPTELLAEQHFRNFSDWFSPLGIEVGWISGQQKRKDRIAQQHALETGHIKIVIGTHAIFQKKVQFHCLALVIIDEQHRFGVHQRLLLLEKGIHQDFYPHQLVMTATPIPRTLAMILYADLDISVITELPKGRVPIKTVVLPDSRRGEIIDRIRRACVHDGHQAYWVCTIISESVSLSVKTVETTQKELKSALPEVKIGLVHGRMQYAERKSIMNKFKKGELQILITTTVIEVGVDVPNASLMIVENSERLGLAQLHQLRGRIGRGTIASYCVLLYAAPLSNIARKRLQILRESNDGFLISKRDLEIRGPGDIFGTRQTGNTKFKIANLLHDYPILPEVYKIACYIHKNFPEKKHLLIRRWIPEIQQYFHA